MHWFPLRSLQLMLFLVVVCATLPVASSAAPWLFKPGGTDVTTDYSPVDVNDGEWQTVRLPHREWDRLQPANYVYGWYRCHFTVPREYKGNELLLKLGIVDDADWTFVNGTPIGTTSAYDAERVYVVPAAVVRPGEDNVLAVKVYDIIGTGGLLSQPRLGLRLTTTKQWLFEAGDAPETASWAAPALDDAQWQKVIMPDEEWDKRQPADNVYGWFRLHFSAPREWPTAARVLDLGIVCDVDQTHINGQLIGETGAFPPKYVSAAGEPRMYSVPDDLLKRGADNVLAVRIFNGTAKGGIQGEPMLQIPLGEPDEATADLARAQRLRHVGKLEEAGKLIRKIIATEKAPAVAAKALDELVVVLGGKGADDEALATFERMLREYPYESCTGDSARVVCAVQSKRKTLCNDVAYLGEDRLTQGRWWLRYGNDGFVLCNAGGDCDVYGVPGAYRFSDSNARNADRAPNAHLPYHALRFTADEDRTTYNWVAAVRTEDARALYNPIIRANTAAWWDDKGETHPFDNQGPDLKVELSIPQGDWRLALYLVDYDWWSSWHPRQQAIVLADEESHVLATAQTGKFGQGVWHRFSIRGPKKVVVRVAKNRANCAILSAIMLDRIPSLLVAETSGLMREQKSAQDFVPTYRKISDTLGDSPSEYMQRLQEIALNPPAAQADELTAALQAWLRWQAMLAGCSDATLLQAELDCYVKALLKLEPEVAEGVLGRQVDTLMRLRQYAAAQALDTVETRLLTDGVPSPDSIQGLQKVVERWCPIDDRFALHVLDKQLAVLLKLPSDIGLPLMAALIEPYADRGRELTPTIVGTYRPATAGHPTLGPLAHPCGTASFGQVALAAIGSLPRADALKHFTPFLSRWGDHERRAVLADEGAAVIVDEQIRALDALVVETLGEDATKASVQADKVYVLAKANRVDDAMKAAQDFWAGNQTQDRWHGLVGTALGEALVRQGRFNEAREVYRRVADSCRDVEPAYARMGLAALAELARLSGDARGMAAALTEMGKLPNTQQDLRTQ